MNSIMTKIKVLAVDDNRTNLHILQVFLKKLGHDVVLAENGEEAVRKFESESPDLVLLDIMMPVMDGFEAARRIKAMTRDRWTPVIFLSALNRDENLVEGLDAGADNAGIHKILQLMNDDQEGERGQRDFKRDAKADHGDGGVGNQISDHR